MVVPEKEICWPPKAIETDEYLLYVSRRSVRNNLSHLLVLDAVSLVV